MKGIYNNILASCLIGIILFSGCSVTKHLPEGEVLYTGGKTVVENKSATPVGETALTEIDAALDKTPSTKRCLAVSFLSLLKCGCTMTS